MKKIGIKICILFSFIGFICFCQCYFDTYNVFHWKKIRSLGIAMNNNFIKTKYVVNNPRKFNAFVFGSSRVGAINCEMLPKKYNDNELYWFNMTHHVGIPLEHFLSLKTFLENNVDVEAVLLGFDEIAMYSSIEDHKKILVRIPYQTYEENRLKFYIGYLRETVPCYIMKKVFAYQPSEHLREVNAFYNYGEYVPFTLSLGTNPNLDEYKPSVKIEYTQKNSYTDIEKIFDLCKRHSIKLIAFTNPVYETTYRQAVDAGYFEFLRKVAQKCEFYNFSSLNNYSTDPKYYFEWSHYRPALGFVVQEFIFGTEEYREKVRDAAGDPFFGMKVNSENINEVIKHLENQINK